MCVSSIILSPKKKSVFDVDKIKRSLKKRRNYVLFQNSFNPKQKKINMAHLSKLGIADPHRVERIEKSWPCYVTYKYISYELQLFLAIHKLFRCGNISIFFIPNLDILTFQVYKNQPLRECRFHNRRFKRWCHNQLQWLLFWRHAVHIPQATKLIPFLQNTNIKQKEFQLQKVCCYRYSTIKKLIQKFLKRPIWNGECIVNFTQSNIKYLTFHLLF